MEGPKSLEIAYEVRRRMGKKKAKMMALGGEAGMTESAGEDGTGSESELPSEKEKKEHKSPFGSGPFAGKTGALSAFDNFSHGGIVQKILERRKMAQGGMVEDEAMDNFLSADPEEPVMDDKMKRKKRIAQIFGSD